MNLAKNFWVAGEKVEDRGPVDASRWFGFAPLLHIVTHCASISETSRHIQKHISLFLAPTGALIVMMVYYTRTTFWIFTQSIAIDAIDVTSVTLSRLKSINAFDVTRCKFMLIWCSNDPMFQCVFLFIGSQEFIIHWSIDSLDHWSNGPLVYWYIGPLVHWSIGPLVKCKM